MIGITIDSKLFDEELHGLLSKSSIQIKNTRLCVIKFWFYATIVLKIWVSVLQAKPSSFNMHLVYLEIFLNFWLTAGPYRSRENQGKHLAVNTGTK